MSKGSVRWLRAFRRSLFATVLASLAQFAHADSGFTPTDYAASWGPSIGSTAPMLSAVDQDGKQQDFSSLKGTNGLLFVFNRSVDW